MSPNDIKIGQLILHTLTGNEFRILQEHAVASGWMIERLNTKEVMFDSTDALIKYYELLLPHAGQEGPAKDGDGKVIYMGAWRDTGCCPHCGTKGDFVNFAMTCPDHGAY